MYLIIICAFFFYFIRINSIYLIHFLLLLYFILVFLIKIYLIPFLCVGGSHILCNRIILKIYKLS